MDERHIHPLTPEEYEAVLLAVKAFIAVLPEGAAERGVERARLESALNTLQKHWCPWCPIEVRDLAAIAHNAAVNHGTERGRRKMGELLRAINRYDEPLDAHFRAVNEYVAQQPVCARLEGCQIKPGGHWHDPECPVEMGLRATFEDLPRCGGCGERVTVGEWPVYPWVCRKPVSPECWR